MWQSEHSPLTGCVVPFASVSGRSTVGGTPGHPVIVFSWQLEHLMPVTALCTMDGGAAPLLFANLKVSVRWQAPHSAPASGT